MKKIMNSPEHIVSEMLRGFVRAHPQLRYSQGLEVVSRAQKSPGKVGVISGGGSGHEPAHAGYVGPGMLDAAVAGNVFSSPSPDRILEGIRQADGGKGVLMVVKNYSGDIMNFEMAGELASMEGIPTATVVVKDDVAVPDSTYSTGRRGIAGTVFVHKIAGAMAGRGASLEEVCAAAQKAAEAIRSMGMAMSPCILPGVGKPGFQLEENEMELGMGIHGEPGVHRQSILSSKELARELVDRILADRDCGGEEAAVLVNGLGATPPMELYVLNNDVQDYLAEKGVKVIRTLVGNYMTSLEMSGCSLTLFGLDEELRSLLEEPCDTPALKWGGE